MNNLHKMKSIGMFLLLALFIFSCAAKVPSTNTQAAKNQSSNAANPAKKEEVKKKATAYSPVGVWEYTVDAPDGATSAVMKITGEPGAYEGSMATDQFGTLEINQIDVVGMSMRGSIEVAGAIAEIEGDFNGDDFSGAIIMGDQVFPMAGTRTSK